MKHRFLFWFLVLLCSISCSKKTLKYNIVLGTYPNEKNYVAYLIIPKQPGCPCNSISYQFIDRISKINNKRLRIFFLNKSSKELEDKIPINILKGNDIIITPCFIDDSKLKFDYPTIIYLKNNTIKRIELQNYENPHAIDKLESFLNKKLNET